MCEHLQWKDLHSLEKPPCSSDMGVELNVCWDMSRVHMHTCLGVLCWALCGTWQGAILENQMPNSSRHPQQLDLAFSCSLPDVTNFCPCPSFAEWSG